MFCEFKYTSSSKDLNLQHSTKLPQNSSAHRNITCAYFSRSYRSYIKTTIKCNLTNTYWELEDSKIAHMHVLCDKLCVQVIWIGVNRDIESSECKTQRVFKSSECKQQCLESSECEKQCPDSMNTTVTPRGFVPTDITRTTTASAATRTAGVSSTNQQTTALTSRVLFSTSKTVPVSHPPTMFTSNILSIIAILFGTLILLGLVIVLFLRKRKKRNLRQTISHGNPDQQEDRQHLSPSITCTPSADASLLPGDYDVVSYNACLEDCNSGNVYSRLREQPSLTTDTYDTLANTTKNPDVNTGTTATNSSHITIIQSNSQTLPVEEIRNKPTATGQIEILSTEVGAYSAVNLPNDDIKEQTRGTSRFINFEVFDANIDHTNAIPESKVPPTENPVYSVVVKKQK